MKKIVYLPALLASCLFVFASCATTGGVEVPNVVPTLPLADGIDFPAPSLRSSVGDAFPAYVSGTVISTYDQLPPVDLFQDPVVTVCSLDYYFNGESLTSEYELIYTGLTTVHTEGPVSHGDDLGIAIRDQVYVIVRTKELHPYFVCSSPMHPVEYNGYWYFYPVPLDSRLPKWLNYAPADYEAFRWMYNHTCEPDSEEADEGWFPGMSYFNWSMYLTTALSQYPDSIEGYAVSQGVKVEYEQVIDWNGFNLHLYYQPGFLGYLQDEYTLGKPIVLYLNIDSISFFEKEFNCYVRDFAFETPEEMTERLTKQLQAVRNAAD